MQAAAADGAAIFQDIEFTIVDSCDRINWLIQTARAALPRAEQKTRSRCKQWHLKDEFCWWTTIPNTDPP
ncbi:MAG: hypothetical protein JXR73_11415 [Candidatus Omnitrophica bacterium]|nr:hypothetical protein [Candidatus Omnitrophota bacterium]